MLTHLLKSSPGGFSAIASCFVTSFGVKFRWVTSLWISAAYR